MSRSWGRDARWLGVATLLYGMAEAWQVQVREYEVALAGLPTSAEGTRVLQISDLHYGPLMPRAVLRHVMKVAAAQQADLVVFTGDMVSRRNSSLPPFRTFAKKITDYADEVAADISELLTAPLGMWCVPGNHDLWNGSFVPISEALARAGVKALLNASVRLSNGLNVVGMDDVRAGNPEICPAFEGIPCDEGHLILSHNPRLTLLLRQHEALVLSGHTHGGQIRLPILPTVLPVDCLNTFWREGFYQFGRVQLYVSAGVGAVALPVRLNMPPEICAFTLRRKTASS